MPHNDSTESEDPADAEKARMLRELRAILDALLQLTDRLTNLIVQLLRSQ